MPDEPTQKFQPRSTFSTWVEIVLLFAFFGLLALVVIGASPRGNTYEKKRAKARAEKLQAAQSEMMTALTTYGWVDKTKGVAHIPVTDAMKLTVAELAQKKPAPANPIATPEAAQSPAPAAAPSPAGSVTPVPSATPTPSTTPKPTTITGPTSESRNQPAAAINPPPAPPKTQPGPSSTPAATPPSAPAKPPASPSPSAKPSPSAPTSPLPVRGKTP
ncbi:MAG: hypothetical protein QOD12_1376 [Verrucomicrobiota bacterium]|jgi:hypothetical protein